MFDFKFIGFIPFPSITPPLPLNYQQNANEILLLTPITPCFLLFLPFLSLHPHARVYSTCGFSHNFLADTAMIPGPHPPLPESQDIYHHLLFTNTVLLVGTLHVFKQAVLGREDVGSNYFLFSLRALVLVLFRADSDSPDAFNFDGAEPPSTPLPPPHRRHTSRFHHLSTAQSPPSFQTVTSDDLSDTPFFQLLTSMHHGESFVAAHGAGMRCVGGKHVSKDARPRFASEPHRWYSEFYAVPGGNVIVQEDDWGRIIAFTLR